MPNPLAPRPEDSLPAWLREARASVETAIQESITQPDLKAMIGKQVEKAKEGNTVALKFVLGTLLGGDALRGATFVQNNYYDGGERPDKDTAAPPGSDGKLAVMRRRATARLPLCQPGDNGTVRSEI